MFTNEFKKIYALLQRNLLRSSHKYDISCNDVWNKILYRFTLARIILKHTLSHRQITKLLAIRFNNL